MWTTYEFVDKEKPLLLKIVAVVHATIRWMKTPGEVERDYLF
jgi:hypothetical protein